MLIRIEIPIMRTLIFLKNRRRVNLIFFFENHPYIPRSNADISFKIEKAFKRPNGTERKWLTYSDKKKALFCTVCLAFSDGNPFTTGMCTWKHIYLRIDEHEKSLAHGKSSEAYFLYRQNKSVDKLLFSTQLELNNKQIMKRRQILDRVINVLKLVGKRGLSYRRNENEAAYSLLDESLDHGTFLEIILLLAKYDIILKEHIESIAQQSKELHDKGHKRRAGSFLTLLSKTTLNSLIGIIKEMLKEKITEHVKRAKMYSVELDTTQDVSVKDQCSIVIRFVKLITLLYYSFKKYKYM